MNRKVILATVGAVLGVAGLWYALLWSPQSSALSKAKARTAAAVAKQSDLGTQLRSLQKAKLTLPDSQARLSRLANAIPDAPGEADLIDQVNGAAKAAGVDFLTMTPQAPSGGGKTAATAASKKQAVSGVEDLTLSLTAQGSYFQLIDFMNRLTALPRLVVMDTVSVNGQDKMTLQVTGRTFLHNTAPPLAPVKKATTATKGASS
jgi:Tfp pilus assembly protein PilO